MPAPGPSTPERWPVDPLDVHLATRNAGRDPGADICLVLREGAQPDGAFVRTRKVDRQTSLEQVDRIVRAVVANVNISADRVGVGAEGVVPLPSRPTLRCIRAAEDASAASSKKIAPRRFSIIVDRRPGSTRNLSPWAPQGASAHGVALLVRAMTGKRSEGPERAGGGR